MFQHLPCILQEARDILAMVDKMAVTAYGGCCETAEAAPAPDGVRQKGTSVKRSRIGTVT
jgi:hypothetical protein